MVPPTTNPQYLVDESGKRRSVLLSVRDYRRLLRYIEDMEDALKLDSSRRKSQEFVDYRVAREELKQAGKL